ncbi:MAG TPA: tetratricopeptide repeat protein [Terriglobia bacterium]|nr:tetratricopeptide repeat protein [Terriglobia bacterium]
MILCVFLSLPGFAAFSQQPKPAGSESPNALMVSAQSAIKRQDYAMAVTKLKPLLTSYPRYAPAWFDLAYAYTGLGQNDNAVNAYRKAIEDDPKLFQARLNLGILLLNLNRPADAVPQLKEAVALNPKDARGRLYLGRAYDLTGDAADAAKELQNATSLQPNSPRGWIELGQMKFNQKDFAAARDAFEKAAAADPKLTEAELGAGLALANLRQDDAAEPYLERYLALSPSDFKARYELATVEQRSGKTQAALTSLQEIAQKDPAFPGIQAAIGSTEMLLKQYPRAEKDYRAALAAAPGNADLHRSLGDALMQERNYPAAQTEFAAALKLNGADRESASGLAASFYFQKRYAEAVPLLQQLVQAPPASAMNYFFLAASYDQLHDARPAIAAYQQFLSLSHGSYPNQAWQAQQRIKLLEHELER